MQNYLHHEFRLDPDNCDGEVNLCFYGLLYKSVSILDCTSSDGWMIFWMISYTVFGGKPNQGNIQAIVWKAWSKQRKPSVRAVDVLAEIWTMHLSNTNLEHYYYINLRDKVNQVLAVIIVQKM